MSVEIPISAPKPYSKPSANRVLALIITARLRRYAATATTGDRAPVLLALLSMLLWTTIIVAGRSDALVPPNHASRAYFGATQLEERGHGRRQDV